MKYILFENDWEIDINSLKFMWCSTKDGIDTIWKFWTWLKYAIAVLMRNWWKIQIFSWKKCIKFAVKEIVIQWKTFNQIVVNWEQIWITTNLWVEWKVWQWIREFYANCIDEWGELFRVDSIWSWVSWKTKVYIEIENINEILEYFQFDWWSESTNWLSFKEKKALSPLKIFKEWFLIYEGESYELSLFDYRTDYASINEARLLENKYEMQLNIGRIIWDMDLDNVMKVVESREFNLTQYYSNLWKWWEQYQKINWWKVDLKNTSLNKWLRILRWQTNKKLRSYSWYHEEETTLTVLEELWEVVIWIDQYMVFSAYFETNENKFDFDLTKNEIYISKEYISEQKKLLLIISDLIENNSKDQWEYIIELLERIYENFNI